jgi:hypothetical protein
MKTTLTAIAAILAVSGCKQTNEPFQPPVFKVTATITEENKCAVSAMGKSYESVNQIRGDAPAEFIGSEPTLPYHGFGCAVYRTDGGNGDIIVLFAKNNFGKALKPGTYQIVSEIVNETPVGYAAVRFNSSDYGPFKLNTMDNLGGTVIVEETATGGRKITVDVNTIQWGEPF